MESSIAFQIYNKPIAYFIILPTSFKILVNAFCIIIVINEAIFSSCIVWWVYVPADFDTNRKSLLRRRSAEKGLK